LQKFVVDPELPVLVEFDESGMTIETAADDEDSLQKKSDKALNTAMNAVHVMALRIDSALSGLVKPPSSVVVEFGIKLTGETGALIAKAGAEATLNVKLTWERKDG